MKRIWLAVLVSLALLAGGAARAQTAPAAAASTDVMGYYKAPDPAGVAGLMQAYEASGALNKWTNRPPLIGFMAVLFERHPDRIDAWLAAAETAELNEVYAVALALAGKRERALALAGQKLAPEKRDVVARTTGRLLEMQVDSPTALDILWGASFASGDGRYVTRIIDSLRTLIAAGPYPSEDVLSLYDAFRKPALRPYARAVIERYDDVDKGRLIVAVTALWALTSNAGQHTFVADAVSASEEAHAGSSFARLTARARFRRENEVLAVTADRVMTGLTQGPALSEAIEQNDIKRALETGFRNDFTTPDGVSIGVLAMVRAGDALTLSFEVTSPAGVVTTVAPVTVATASPAAVELNIVPLEAAQLQVPGVYRLKTVIAGLPGGAQTVASRFLVSPP